MLCVRSFVRSGMAWSEQAELRASDRASSRQFGFSCALSGDTAIVGAIHNPPFGTRGSGSTYVFVRTGTLWTEQAKLAVSDPANVDEFGHSVSISGDTAVVGAPDNDEAGESAGCAYVFVRNGTSWTQQAKLFGSDAFTASDFGFSVSLHGDTLIVGAPGVDRAGEPAVGSAYVFVRQGTTWTEQARLVSDDADAFDRLGWSVGLWGDSAVIGTFFGGARDAGAAYVFERANSTWRLRAMLEGSDATDFRDRSGNGVAIFEETALIGAWGLDLATSNEGAAYALVKYGATWSERARLVANDPAESNLLGIGVALSGDTLIAGAQGDARPGGVSSGSAYVFVAEPEPVVTFDFETEDDFSTPLANGQHLNTEFGRLATMTSSGVNSGLGIFGKRPGAAVGRQLTG